MAKQQKRAVSNKNGGNSRRAKSVPQRRDKMPSDSDGSPAADAKLGEEAADDFPIVGIGASAGGLQPLKEFLAAFPDDPGVALVIVQHLDPTRKSLAPEILAPHTSMKLCEVVDHPRVQPNSVYVIPPGKYLSISKGELQLSEPDQPRGARMAIDYFLRSLARDSNQRSVGIIMSGAGTDGTLGIKLIKEVGGMVIVQDPETADHDNMPRSAIDTGVVDFILEPSKMADVLVRYAEHSYVRQLLPIPLEEPAAAKLEPSAVEVFNSILSLLRVRTKHDFRNYKGQTLVRRTRRRMCLAHLDDYEQYLEYLREHPEEIDALVKDLLISVTNFFRDEEAWEEVRKLAIVPIVEQSNLEEAIRVWVPGCATGEEPYSLAMLLLEELTNAKKLLPIQIFASDIDKNALDFARHGVYPAAIQADVSPERLKRFFVKVDGDDHYRVGKQLRESVVFAEQNLIGDPPFSKLNLICCRNLLIYLKPDIQEKVISLFHFALRDGGYLFLGSAETIGRQTDLFRSLSKRWRVFRRVGPSHPERVEIPFTTVKREIGHAEPALPDIRESRLAHLANQSVVDWMAPAAVLIDEKWNILYINGNVDRYLQHTQGVPKVDLLEKVRRGLRIKLRGAVLRALEENDTVSVTAQVELDGENCPVRISVRPIRDRKEDRRLTLILFTDETSTTEPRENAEASAKGSTAAKSRKSSRATQSTAGAAEATDLDEHQAIQQLEQELAEAREDLQVTLEQFEAANEEFKAANEEVMSINEELQSTNEEMETSKEELQSLNEELSTVNNQLATKVEELETQHADLKNLVSSTDVATVCVDREHHIRWFTPAATRVIRLNESDAGRPLSDFSHDFDIDDLTQVTNQVLKTLMPVHDEVTGHHGRTYLRRVVPYRTEDDRIAGIIITFVDITERKKSEIALAESERRQRELARSLEHQVENRTQAVRVLHEITKSANEATTFDAAVSYSIERICHYNSWVVGHAWLVSDVAGLVSAKVWHYVRDESGASGRFDNWRRNIEDIALPGNDSFVGEVVRTGRLKLISDVANLKDWGRDHPAQLGIRSAVAFPVIVHDQVVAVLEFFSDGPIQDDDGFLEIMPQVGIQLGHVYQRNRLEREVAVAADAEQQRISRELHDGLSQQIAGIGMLANSLADTLRRESPPHAERADKLLNAIEAAKRQTRDLSKGLMPFEIESHGLCTALEELAERTQAAHEVDCVFECEDEPPETGNFIATHLYRIAQEAVHNAIKHAKARRIKILLENGSSISLEIRDDGVGIQGNRNNEGQGLRIMRYRAALVGANLSVQSAETGGTIVKCVLDR
jgi:two-component system CheB/CheR fusion protein